MASRIRCISLRLIPIATLSLAMPPLGCGSSEPGSSTPSIGGSTCGCGASTGISDSPDTTEGVSLRAEPLAQALVAQALVVLALVAQALVAKPPLLVHQPAESLRLA
jgi:hypothetical protein